MPTKFSPQLIERMQKHFATKFHKHLTSEEACEYLDAWGGFYLTVVDWNKLQNQMPGLPGSQNRQTG